MEGTSIDGTFIEIGKKVSSKGGKEALESQHEQHTKEFTGVAKALTSPD